MSKRTHGRIIVWIPERNDEPFIVAMYGRFTSGFIAEIENEILDQGTAFTDGFPSDSEVELSIFSYFHGQYDEYGRCEVGPHWDWDERLIRTNKQEVKP